MKLDWVVNEDTYGREAAIVVPTGTVGAAPLTFAPFLFRTDTFAGAIGRTRAAFPEGEKQFVKAVVGSINVFTSAWAVGSQFEAMIRIVKKPMDFATAAAITDVGYDPCSYVYANERFAWQRMLFDQYQPGSQKTERVLVKATVNQWLEPDEALFIVYANTGVSTTVNLTFRPYLRTLMRADS